MLVWEFHPRFHLSIEFFDYVVNQVRVYIYKNARIYNRWLICTNWYGTHIPSSFPASVLNAQRGSRNRQLWYVAQLNRELYTFKEASDFTQETKIHLLSERACFFLMVASPTFSFYVGRWRDERTNNLKESKQGERLASALDCVTRKLRSTWSEWI